MESSERQPLATIGHSYGYGWQQMKKYILHLFLVIVIICVAQIPTGMVNDFDIREGFSPTPGEVFLQIVGFIYWLLIMPVVQYGGSFMFLKAARNETFEIKEMFKGFNNYLNVVLAHLLTSAIIAMGFVMLIVPGIIMACRLAFVPYLVMDRNMEPIAAVEKSWQMTKGHGWTVFGMAILAIPVIIIGLMMVFVGVLFSAMLISTAYAALYYAVELKEQKSLEADELAPS